jgi:hypothetical protein
MDLRPQRKARRLAAGQEPGPTMGQEAVSAAAAGGAQEHAAELGIGRHHRPVRELDLEREPRGVREPTPFGDDVVFRIATEREQGCVGGVEQYEFLVLAPADGPHRDSRRTDAGLPDNAGERRRCGQDRGRWAGDHPGWDGSGRESDLYHVDALSSRRRSLRSARGVALFRPPASLRMRGVRICLSQRPPSLLEGSALRHHTSRGAAGNPLRALVKVLLRVGFCRRCSTKDCRYREKARLFASAKTPADICRALHVSRNWSDQRGGAVSGCGTALS